MLKMSQDFDCRVVVLVRHFLLEFVVEIQHGDTQLDRLKKIWDEWNIGVGVVGFRKTMRSLEKGSNNNLRMKEK